MATTDIFAKCLPAIRTNIDTCGALTQCDVEIPLPSELDTIFGSAAGNYRHMEALFMHDMTAKACGVREHGLYDFFMAQSRNMEKKIVSESINSGLTMIRPYIQVQRQHPINNNYWKVTDGQASGGNWQFDAVSMTDIPADTGFFNAGEYVFIKGQAADGTSIDWQGIVVSRSIVASKVRVIATAMVAGSFLDSARTANPVTGLAERGTANVSDYESFCARPPGLINTTLDPFWIQTTRDYQCHSELVEKYLNLIRNNNPLYREFYDLPEVQYNRQTAADWQRRWVNTLFRNKPISANQTLASMANLANITTAAIAGSKCVGKKANAIGYYEQMAEVNRVIDCQGAAVNWPRLLETLYSIARIREYLGSKTPWLFEIGTDSTTLYQWQLAYIDYMKSMTGNSAQFNYDFNKQVKRAPLGMKFVEFEFMWPASLVVRLFTDYYLDDYRNAAIATGLTTVGNQLMIYDWANMYPGIIATNRVVNKTGDLNILANADPDNHKCIMALPSDTHTFTSVTYTGVCLYPRANLHIENFANGKPEPITTLGTNPYDIACT